MSETLSVFKTDKVLLMVCLAHFVFKHFFDGQINLLYGCLIVDVQHTVTKFA